MELRVGKRGWRAILVRRTKIIRIASTYLVLLLVVLISLYLTTNFDAPFSVVFFVSLFTGMIWLTTRRPERYFEYVPLLSFLTVVYWAFFFIDSHGTFQFLNFNVYEMNNYGTLVSLFEHGNLGITLNNGAALHDFAFYNGVNYVYFGPLPAILWLALKYALGFTPLFSELTLVFVLINLMEFHVFLADLTKFFGLRSTHVTMRFFFLSLYAIGPLMYLSWRYAIYETAIIFGSTFALLSSIFFVRYYNSRNRSLRFNCGLLVGAATSLALAFFSRATLILLIVPFFTFLFSKDVFQLKYKEARFCRGWLLLSVLTIPILCAGLLYGYYNMIRFGNPFEFGLSYVFSGLSTEVMRFEGGQSTSLSYLVRNIYHIVFFVPPMTNVPPFVHYFDYPAWLVGDSYPKLVAIEWGASIFFSSPLLLLAFSPISKLRMPKSRGNVALLLMLVVFSGLYAVCYMSYSRRYLQEFYPYVVALAFLGAVCVMGQLRSLGKWPRLTFMLVLIGGFIWALFISIDLNLQLWALPSVNFFGFTPVQFGSFAEASWPLRLTILILMAISVVIGISPYIRHPAKSDVERNRTAVRTQRTV
jgi:hypothetical protein